MATLEEHLKLKRIPIDKWSVKEQLCLSSSVLRSGDQNWSSVSRALKIFREANRPDDWFSQKNCAVQYSNMLEKAEIPKRKKRSSSEKDNSTVETAGEIVLRKCTAERIEELKAMMEADRADYLKLQKEVGALQSGEVSDDQLAAWALEIESEKKQAEIDAQNHALWLKERELKKAQIERGWIPKMQTISPLTRRKVSTLGVINESTTQSELDSTVDSTLNSMFNTDPMSDDSMTDVKPLPSTPTSPFLTSLLKSPSPVKIAPTSSILHSAITSQRGSTPTITSLLSSSPGVPQVHLTKPPQQVQEEAVAAAVPTLSMLLQLPSNLQDKQAHAKFAASENIHHPQHQELQLVKGSETDEILDVVDVEQALEVEDMEPIEIGLEEIIADLEQATSQGMLASSGKDGGELKLENVPEHPTNVDSFHKIFDDFYANVVKPKMDSGEIPSTDTSLTLEDKTMDTSSNIDESLDKIEDVLGSKEVIELIENSSSKKPLLIDGLVIHPVETGTEVKMKSENVESVDIPALPEIHDVSIDLAYSDTANSSINEEQVNGKSEEVRGLDTSPKVYEKDVSIEVEYEDALAGTTSTNDEKDAKIIEEIISKIPEAKDLDTTTEVDNSKPEEVKEEFTEETEDLETDTKQPDDDVDSTAEADSEVNDIEASSQKDLEAEDTTEDVAEENGDTDENSEDKTMPSEKDDETTNEVPDDDKPDDSGKDEVTSELDDESSEAKREKDDKVNEEEEHSEVGKALATDRESSRTSVEESLKGEDKATDDSNDALGSQEESIASISESSHDKPSATDVDTKSETQLPETNTPVSRRMMRRTGTPAIDSLPGSPASIITDEEKEYRVWKKAIILVWNSLAAHKYASIFCKPITDEVAPDYSLIVEGPMDLPTIKRNVETGQTRTTNEFQRDVMRMFMNAVMYNKTGDDVYRMALSMQADSLQQIMDFKETQKMIQSPDSAKMRRETRTMDSANPNKRRRDSDLIKTTKKRKVCI